MNPYTKICIIAGLCTSTYLILKFIKTCLEQGSKQKLDSEKEEEKDKKSSSDGESKSKKKSVSFDSEKTRESKRKRTEKEPEENAKAMKFPQVKPNFFIAVQIFDKEIHEKVKRFQEMIIRKNPLLYPALIPVSTLHITLAVTYLANETEIKKLKTKLEEWSEKNVQSYMKEPMVLNFNCVNTFNDIVAYVNLKKCQNCQKLSELAQAMNDLITSAGFINDSRKFTPHLTILKLSRDYNLLHSKKNFKEDFAFMKQCKEHFGKEEVKYIQLLSMTEPKGENGYYKCYHQIKISKSEVEADHSMCCSLIPEPKVEKEET